jgi:hypothetical protein
LTGLGIEQGCKRVLTGKLGTITLQVILGDTLTIHPFAYTLIANELHNAYGLFYGGILLLASCYLVLQDEHGFSLQTLVLVYSLSGR